MGNISSDVVIDYNPSIDEFEIITETTDNVLATATDNVNLSADLKNIQLNYNTFFSIYKNIIQENKTKQD